MKDIENGLNLENLKKAIEESKYGRIKNYKVMAEVLGDKYTTDKKKRDLQLKEWKRYFSYKITGNGSFEIKEIYDKPLPSKEPKELKKVKEIKEPKIKKKKYRKPEITILYEADKEQMKIYELSQDLNEGCLVFNYVELCNKLNIPILEGDNKTKQLSELKHFIEYEQKEDTYIITKVLFPIIKKDCFIFDFLREPDYYHMGCIYSHSDEERVSFSCIIMSYINLIKVTYYHYWDKINTLWEYPKEKDLQIRIEKIIPNKLPIEAKEDLDNFIDNYQKDYELGLVNKKISNHIRIKPRIKKTITIYEEDYKKILDFAQKHGIKILE